MPSFYGSDIARDEVPSVQAAQGQVSVQVFAVVVGDEPDQIPVGTILVEGDLILLANLPPSAVMLDLHINLVQGIGLGPDVEGSVGVALTPTMLGASQVLSGQGYLQVGPMPIAMSDNLGPLYRKPLIRITQDGSDAPPDGLVIAGYMLYTFKPSFYDLLK